MDSMHTKKYLAMTTLYFGCKLPFIEEGKRYNSHTFGFAKNIGTLGSNVWLRTEDGEKIQLSGVKGDKWDYRGLFKKIEVK